MTSMPFGSTALPDIAIALRHTLVNPTKGRSSMELCEQGAADARLTRPGSVEQNSIP
eukprot:CAMPEP_0197253664 /NCGR_PEP_ID=MMETSP1429-20130617/65893_1 /TAXON_ID=49237 /ORGANISM="Chaetoceros  sp., Strain UNC1202" /LENGTH=56 /DNA_ID=CAMNT_0042716427 /DNA_START=6 /DNA_END=172 /DNA_ORIENTATION=+